MAFFIGDQVRLLKTTSGIDATGTGPVTVLPASARPQVITQVIVRLTAAAAVVSPPTAQVETASGAGTANVFASEEWTALTAIPGQYTYTALAKGVYVPAGDSVRLNITTAASAGTYTISVDVVGYVVS